MIERKLLLENLLRLRSRIEDWTIINGWENMDNHKEKKNKQGRVVWKLSDWEFVDSMYGAVYNGDGGFGNDYSLDVMDDTMNISWDIKNVIIKKSHKEEWWDKEK